MNYKSPAVLAGAGTVLALLAAESLLRLLGMSYPSFYTWNQHVGTAAIPNAAGWWRGEGEVHYITYNSRGLRDREHELAKDETVLRLLVVGDSFVEAMQLPIEAAFWSLLEEEMGQCLTSPWTSVEVINFGLSGTGTAEQLLKLRHEKALSYSPDMVVLTFFPGNDIRNNSFALERSAHKPYFTLDGDGELVLSTQFQDESLARRVRSTVLYRMWLGLRRRSRLAQLVNHWPILSRERARRVAAISRGDPDGREAGISAAVYREPANQAWRDAWSVTEVLIDAMHREVAAGGAGFLVVVVGTGVQVHPRTDVRLRLARELGLSDLLYPNRRILRLGERQGFEVLDLTPRFRDHAEETGHYLHGFAEQNRPGSGHWNRLGHRLASTSIAETLCDRLARLHPSSEPR